MFIGTGCLVNQTPRSKQIGHSKKHDKTVPNLALVVGNPTTQSDWVCRCPYSTPSMEVIRPAAGLSKLNCLQPDMYFSNPGDLTAYLNGNSGRAIDVYFKISLQPHK